MGVGGARSNGVSAGAQAQIEDLTTQVFVTFLKMLVAATYSSLSLVSARLARSCSQVLAEVKAKKPDSSEISLKMICTGKPP